MTRGEHVWMPWFMDHSVRYYWSLSFTRGPSPLSPLHRFPHHPFLPHQSISVMWDVSPSITLKLVPAFPVFIGHLTCENNFCGAIVGSVVFKQSQRMGRGTHPCPLLAGQSGAAWWLCSGSQTPSPGWPHRSSGWPAPPPATAVGSERNTKVFMWLAPKLSKWMNSWMNE